MTALLCPAGWGYHPRAPIGDVELSDLPELPLLPLLKPRAQGAAIVAALRPLPFLRRVTARHVSLRYGVSPQRAWELRRRALEAAA